jgi:hypothetical protein
MTSEWKGSPVKVRESLARQAPVVSVLVGYVPRILEGLSGCEIAPCELTTLARAVSAAFEAGRPPELRRHAELWSRRPAAERVARVYESAVRAGYER